MKKGQILEGTADRVNFPNKTVVWTEEGTVVVKNVIPGQRIRLAVTKKRSGRAEGRLLEVVASSPLESRAPSCGEFPDCGGCTWQTMGYESQLKMKEEQVKNLLDPVIKASGVTEWNFEGIHRSPQEFAYRNKMEFSFGDAFKGGPLSLGLHKRGSRYDVLTTSDCRLVHSDITAILRAVLDFFTDLSGTSNAAYAMHYNKMTHEGTLRHLLLRRSETNGEILVCLVSAGTFPAELAQTFCERLLKLPLDGRIAGILHMRNDSVADVVQSDETTVLYGRDFLSETLLGLSFKITPFSFFQTNSLGAELLYGIARDYIGDTKDLTLFDLYSGTGTIAQILAPVAKKVIGVEIVEEAVEAARENARRNGLSNCSFLAGDVLKVIDTIAERPDCIVLDPPRDGIHPKALPRILAYGAPLILYISCKPTSLARDLETILSSGYQVEKVCCVDMFPQTANVETVVGLQRKHT